MKLENLSTLVSNTMFSGWPLVERASVELAAVSSEINRLAALTHCDVYPDQLSYGELRKRLVEESAARQQAEADRDRAIAANQEFSAQLSAMSKDLAEAREDIESRRLAYDDLCGRNHASIIQMCEMRAERDEARRQRDYWRKSSADYEKAMHEARSRTMPQPASEPTDPLLAQQRCYDALVDKIEEAASKHFQQDTITPRQTPLTEEELNALVADDYAALQPASEPATATATVGPAFVYQPAAEAMPVCPVDVAMFLRDWRTDYQAFDAHDLGDVLFGVCRYLFERGETK